ncbi:MAG: filamentous hemagglutinin N-terminal domain-containing protein [Magnetococcus sp. MYC-9]
MKPISVPTGRMTVLVCLAAALLSAAQALAGGITLDGSMQPAFTGAIAKMGSTYPILQTYGRTVGGNLFHSFSQFGLSQGETADFQGSGVTNILARVTGGSRSEIDGTLRSTMPGANLYLMNPSGIVFGPNAALDVAGSFHATTADSLRLGNEGKYDASPNRASVLVQAEPTAFGFLNAKPATIVLNGSPLSGHPGSALSFIGGDITLTEGSAVTQAGGSLTFAATASSGELSASATLLDSSGFATLGAITLQGARIDTSAEGAGSVRVRGKSLTMTESRFTLDSHAADGGSLDLNLSGQITLANATLRTNTDGPGRGGNISLQANTLTSHDSTLKTFADRLHEGEAWHPKETGRAGDITLQAKTIHLLDDAVGSTTYGTGQGGHVTLHADQLLSQGTDITTRTVNVQPDTLHNAATGKGGDIAIVAKEITLSGGSVSASTEGSSSRGGNVTLQAERVETHNQVNLAVTTDSGGSGDAGTLRVDAKTLSLRNSVIDYSADNEEMWDSNRLDLFYGSGAGGRVFLNGQEIRIQSSSFQGWSDSKGAAGTVTINATGPLLLDGVTLNNTAMWSGQAGDITLHAARMVMQNASLIESDANGYLSVFPYEDGSFDPYLKSLENAGVVFKKSTCSGCTHLSAYPHIKAGTIRIAVDSLEMLSGSQISTAANYFGQAGDIVMDINRLTVDGYGRYGAIGFVPSGIVSQTYGSGEAGSITLTTQALAFTHGGRIDVSSSGEGQAGSLIVHSPSVLIAGAVPDTVALYAANNVHPPKASGFYSSVSGTGNAGTITVTAGTLALADRGRIESSTAGAGAGGSISMQADAVRLQSGAIILSNSESTAAGAGKAGSVTLGSEALPLQQLLLNQGTLSSSSAQGGGGDITLRVRDRIRLTQANISTSVQGGDGNGGNIDIDPIHLILDHSRIQANAYQGAGGRVILRAQTLIRDPGSRVTASSTLGVQGTVTIDTPDVNVVDSLSALPTRFFDASSLLGERCSARQGDSGSSFVLKGRGALPVMPGDLLAGHGGVEEDDSSTQPGGGS